MSIKWKAAIVGARGAAPWRLDRLRRQLDGAAAAAVATR